MNRFYVVAFGVAFVALMNWVRGEKHLLFNGIRETIAKFKQNE